jgi:patatin-related protein
MTAPSPDNRPTTLAPLQIRVATVMTGGVSLAVWMGGIAAELDRLRRSNPTAADPGNVGAAPAEPAYAALLGLLNATVEFDVFAGTSAGGINAAANALAAATDGSTDTLRSTWIELGSLQDLLRSPLEKNPPSLMYGDAGLLEGLRAGLPHVVGPALGTPDAAGAGGDYPRLAITTTLLRGEASRFRDDLGTLVQDVDHHGLFVFDRADLLDPQIVPKLALAARSSASFPAAFEASRVPVGQALDPEHPDMGKHINATSTGWAVDGGVLANRPLGPALRWVFERPSQHHVRRVLAYVVPSSGEPPRGQASAAVATDPPGMVQTLLGTVGALANQSIAAELETIHSHNLAVGAQARARGHLASLLLLGSPDQQAAQIDAMWPDYVHSRAEREAQELLDEVDRHVAGRTSASRLPAAWRNETAALPTSPRGWHRAAFRTRLDELPRVAPLSSEDLPSLGLDTLERSAAVVLRLTKSLYPVTVDEETAKQIEYLDEVKRMVHGTLAAARDAIVQSRGAPDLEKLVDRQMPPADDPSPPPIPDWIASLARRWPHPDPTQSDAVTERLSQAWQALAEASTMLSTVSPDDGENELRYLGDTGGGAVRLARMVIAQEVLSPAPPVLDQRVELMQMSADTGTHITVDSRGRTRATDKLTGLQLNHFGAFYRRAWRANDWMWGRLDGVGWVMHMLLAPDRVRHLATTAEGVIAVLSEATGARVGDAGAAVTVELERLLRAPEDALPSGLPHTASWTASAVQRRVAWEELQRVNDLLQDSAEPATAASGDFRRMASRVFAPHPGGDPDDDTLRSTVPELLGVCRVGEEKILDDARSGSQLFVKTASKTLATGSAAAQAAAGESPPAPLRPVLPVLRGAAATTYIVGMGATSIPQVFAYLVGAGGIAALTGGAGGIAAVVHAGAVVAFGLLLLLFLYVGFSRIGLRVALSAALAVAGVLVAYVAAAPFIPTDWQIGGWQPRDGPFTALDAALGWLQEHAVAWLILVLGVLGLALRPWSRRRRARPAGPGAADTPAAPGP